MFISFTVILCSTALTSILSCVRYVSEQTCKVTSFIYVVFLFFFQLNVTTWFLHNTFFRHFKVFTKNNMVMPGSTICLYIDKKERTLFIYEPNFTARRPLLTEKRRMKTYFFSLITMVITVETRSVRKTSLYFLFLAFYFDRSRSPYMHTTFRTWAHSTSMVAVII